MTRKNMAFSFLLSTGVLCTGCAQAPSIDVMGSFFPAWMICLTFGVVMAFVLRKILTGLHLESEVGPLALFYPCVVLLGGALLWLILFR
jgi:hypothetical protein